MPNVVRRIAFIAAVVVGGSLSVGAEQATQAQWVTAWSTSQQGQGNTSLSNATIRLMARVTASGEAIRIRLDNSYGTRPLVVAAATVGEPMRGAVLSPGSTQPISFDGELKSPSPSAGVSKVTPSRCQSCHNRTLQSVCTCRKPIYDPVSTTVRESHRISRPTVRATTQPTRLGRPSLGQPHPCFG